MNVELILKEYSYHLQNGFLTLRIFRIDILKNGEISLLVGRALKRNYALLNINHILIGRNHVSVTLEMCLLSLLSLLLPLFPLPALSYKTSVVEIFP